MTRDDELHELLSALLDGELAPDEAAEVRAYVERTPEAQVELDGLARVRSWVRDLPAVDPPFGFYERMLQPKARARRYGPKLGAAICAAAAAIVVLVGVTPISDRVAPPVNAYAERHMHMVTPSPSTPDPATGTSLGAAAGTTAPTVPVSAPPTSGEFNAMPAAELDRHGVPAQLDSGYRRMGGYTGQGGVMHVMYTNGAVVISVYEQPGTVAWDSLPGAGAKVQVGTMAAWDMTSDREEVMVIERGATVYTLVAVNGHDDMLDVVTALPDPPGPSLADRMHQACESIVDHFGFDQ